MALDDLLTEIRACTVCAADLPDGPRPIVQAGARARVVVIGQAPGRRVHESGVPWDDPSGDRLREWLAMDQDEFYDPNRVALIPTGFCYPGTGKSGDNPPRPECAPLWHDALLEHLPSDRLEVVIGRYAMDRYAGMPGANVTEIVAAWREHLPSRIVMPHPSPRNNRWLTRNPWFESETLPALRARVREVLEGLSE